MKKLRVLTEDEVKLDKLYREHLEAQRIIKQQRETCDHTWRFVCHCHNDAAYECTKCGEAEYR